MDRNALFAHIAETLEFYRDEWRENADGGNDGWNTRTWMEPTDNLLEDGGRRALAILSLIRSHQAPSPDHPE